MALYHVVFRRLASDGSATAAVYKGGLEAAKGHTKRPGDVIVILPVEIDEPDPPPTIVAETTTVKVKRGV